ncbi:MAG TPA: RagB/SusD family nutrient uptake outer membrane protein [Chryseolinea sp.]|nr:RagB/SusD family nutrient uptake outer membrane protein [Chryseolinea sp.]
MKNIKYSYCFIILLLVASTSCDILSPEPIDILTDDVVLNEANDVPAVEIGLYSAFRPIIPAAVISGDATADMLQFRGTFNQYRELGTKQITSSNGSVTALWASIYNTIYIANFIIEKLPTVPGVTSTDRNRVLGTAHFLRGYAYFLALYTYGGVPKVTGISIEVNSNIARASEEEILDFILEDYTEALDKLPVQAGNAGYASDYALRAALAKYHLYNEDWTKAEQFATNVIASNEFTLEPEYQSLVTEDFTDEAIFEVGYTLSDDPGTDPNIGLNNIFVGRREMIPSNQLLVALDGVNSGDRYLSVSFDSRNLKGNDNGYSVAKYGTADANNNNVVVFRLGEMHLIRAEARANLNKVSGTNSAQEDINALRTRANAPLVGSVTQAQMLSLIEEERKYELAFEGHRWYDLVRTGRAKAVMTAFSSNWKDAYELWPIPQREILNNPSLADDQNPGY